MLEWCVAHTSAHIWVEGDLENSREGSLSVLQGISVLLHQSTQVWAHVAYKALPLVHHLKVMRHFILQTLHASNALEPTRAACWLNKDCAITNTASSHEEAVSCGAAKQSSLIPGKAFAGARVCKLDLILPSRSHRWQTSLYSCFCSSAAEDSARMVQPNTVQGWCSRSCPGNMCS